LFGAQFATADAAAPSFKGRFPWAIIILDFVCFEHRLVVEIDGPSHEAQEQRLADQNRDVWLREQGFRVLRLQNELVIASTELAMARIRDALTK
jgi:very-short-patch-repair endonuclease